MKRNLEFHKSEIFEQFEIWWNPQNECCRRREWGNNNTTRATLYTQFTLQCFEREAFNSLGINTNPFFCFFYLLHFSSSMLLTTVIVCLCTYIYSRKKLKQQTMNFGCIKTGEWENAMQVGLDSRLERTYVCRFNNWFSNNHFPAFLLLVEWGLSERYVHVHVCAQHFFVIKIGGFLAEALYVAFVVRSLRLSGRESLISVARSFKQILMYSILP